MAAFRRVYDSHQLQADCQEPGSAPEPYARQSSMGYIFYPPISAPAANPNTISDLNKSVFSFLRQLTT